jgi:hypothetical protein
MIGQLYAPTALPHERNAAPVKKKLDWLKKRSGDFGEGKFLFPVLGFKPRIFQPVAQ